MACLILENFLKLTSGYFSKISLKYNTSDFFRLYYVRKMDTQRERERGMRGWGGSGKR